MGGWKVIREENIGTTFLGRSQIINMLIYISGESESDNE
jgi:hypothetical protein